MVWILSLALVAGVSRHLTGAISLVSILVLAAAVRRRPALWALAFLAVGCAALGAGAARRMDADEACVRAAAARRGAALTELRGWVCGFPRTGPHGTVFEFATRVDGRAVTLEVRAAFFDVSYGDGYRLRARLLAATDRDRSYLRARGVAGRARVRLRDAERTGQGNGAWVSRELFWPLHRGARTELSRRMGNDAGLVLGLLLGERGHMDDATRDAVRRLGIAHLLAISGMHLTSIAGCVLIVTRLWPGGATAILLAGLSLYTGMVGNVESLTRAYIMSLLVAASHLLVRPVRPFDVLGTAFLLMMLASPLSFHAVGLQLSFAATFALVAVLPSLRGLWRRTAPPGLARIAAGAGRAAASAFLVSLAVEVFIAPLQLHHFGAISIAGPLATVLFMAPVTALLLGSFPALLLSPWPAAAGVGAHVLALASGWTADLIREAGSAAPALLAPGRPDVVFYYASLAVAWRLRRRWYGWLAGLAGLAAAFAAGG